MSTVLNVVHIKNNDFYFHKFLNFFLLVSIQYEIFEFSSNIHQKNNGIRIYLSRIYLGIKKGSA